MKNTNIHEEERKRKGEFMSELEIINKIVNVTEARRRLTSLVRELGKAETVYLTVYGKPQAVLLRFDTFVELVKG